MANSNSKDGFRWYSRRPKWFKKPTMLRLNSVGEVVSPLVPNHHKNIDTTTDKLNSNNHKTTCSFNNVMESSKASMLNAFGLTNLCDPTSKISHEDLSSFKNLMNVVMTTSDDCKLKMDSGVPINSDLNVEDNHSKWSLTNLCGRNIQSKIPVKSFNKGTNSIMESSKYPFTKGPIVGNDKLEHCDMKKKFNCCRSQKNMENMQNTLLYVSVHGDVRDDRPCETPVYTVAGSQPIQIPGAPASTCATIPVSAIPTCRTTACTNMNVLQKKRSETKEGCCDIPNTFHVKINDPKSGQVSKPCVDTVCQCVIRSPSCSDGDNSSGSEADLLMNIDVRFPNCNDSFTWDTIYDEQGEFKIEITEQENSSTEDKQGSPDALIRLSSISCSSDGEMEIADTSKCNVTGMEGTTGDAESNCDRIKVLYIRPQKKVKRKRKKNKTKDALPDNSAKPSSSDSKRPSESKFKIHVFNTNHFVVTPDDYESDSDSDSDSFFSSSDDELHAESCHKTFDDTSIFFGGLCDINKLGVHVSVSIVPSPPSENQFSYKQAVIDANSRWAENYKDVPSPVTIDSECICTSKVNFDDSHLVNVHPMVAWSFAYQAARKGHWEEYVRDRDRFQRRIEEAESILAPILSQQHREKMFKKIHTC